jgi:hypothetical protein
VQIQFQFSQYSVAFCEKEKISKNLQKGPMVTKVKKTENKMEFKKMGKREFRFNPIAVPLKGRGTKQLETSGLLLLYLTSRRLLEPYNTTWFRSKKA